MYRVGGVRCAISICNSHAPLFQQQLVKEMVMKAVSLLIFQFINEFVLAGITKSACK